MNRFPSSSQRLRFPLAMIIALLLLAASHGTAQSQGAGAVAITGIKTNGSPDSFTIVPLQTLTAGTRIYFTDNGWTGSAFRGSSGTDYNGNEGLLVLEVKSGQTIQAGTTISSTLGTGFTQYTFQEIKGDGTLDTANLAFANDGEQLYAFSSTQALPTTGNPLNATSSMTQVFALTTTTSWTNANSSSTGSIPSGLSESAGTALKRSSQQNGSSYFDVTLLTDPNKARTGAEWLTAIKNSSNWSTATSTTFTLPTSTLKAGLEYSGTGTWDTTSAQWTNFTASDTTWSNTNQSNTTAIFRGTGTAVSITAGGVSANGLRIESLGYSFSGGGLTLTGTSPTITVATGVTSTIDAQISGSAGLVKAGGGTLVLTAENTYTGGTTVAEGTLTLGSGSTTGSIVGDVAVSSGATLRFNRSDDVTFSGNISGLGTVVQEGPGKLTLTGASNVAVTEVNGGTLAVDGTLASTVNVNSGGTLGGSGTISPGNGNSVSIASGAFVAPNGTSTAYGTLTIGNSGTPTTVNFDGTYLFELGVAGTGSTDPLILDTGGSSQDATHDFIDAYGTLNFGGTSTVNLTSTDTSFDKTLNYSWLIARVTDPNAEVNQFNGTPSLGTVTWAGYAGSADGAFSLSANNGNLYLNYAPAPVPEPTTVLAIGAAGLGLFGAVRRWRRAAPETTPTVSA